VGTRCANHVTPLYPQKLALTSPTGGGRSVGMVRSRTKAMEYVHLHEDLRVSCCRQHKYAIQEFCVTLDIILLLTATNSRVRSVLMVKFALQQWLRESSTVLLYTYIAYLFHINSCDKTVDHINASHSSGAHVSYVIHLTLNNTLTHPPLMRKLELP